MLTKRNVLMDIQDMNRSNLNLVDLPDEMLIYILNKLENVDVLYSFYGINNNRLERLVRSEKFSSKLKFTANVVDETKVFDQFCDFLLREIHFNVESLTVQLEYLERIFAVSHYPKLSQLEILNFRGDQFLRYLSGRIRRFYLIFDFE